LYFLDFIKLTLENAVSLAKISSDTNKLPAAALSGLIWLSETKIGVLAVFFLY
jgi:hypothetical protein